MRRAKDTGTLLAPFAVGVLAVACCAGLPLLAGVFAGLTLGALLGVGGGLIVLFVTLATLFFAVRTRHRRSCPPPNPRSTP